MLFNLIGLAPKEGTELPSDPPRVLFVADWSPYSDSYQLGFAWDRKPDAKEFERVYQRHFIVNMRLQAWRMRPGIGFGCRFSLWLDK